MNPGEQLVDPVTTNILFDEWTTMLQENKRHKKEDLFRLMPLMEFDLTNKNQVYTQDLD